MKTGFIYKYQLQRDGLNAEALATLSRRKYMAHDGDVVTVIRTFVSPIKGVSEAYVVEAADGWVGVALDGELVEATMAEMHNGTRPAIG